MIWSWLSFGIGVAVGVVGAALFSWWAVGSIGRDRTPPQIRSPLR